MQFFPNYRITLTAHIAYYESRKREIKIRLMNEGRNDERLKNYCVYYESRNKN